MTLANLLVLADGRMPAGAHAHSAGIEVFARRGEVHDIASLREFLRGRISTSGYVDATVAAAVVLDAANGPPDLDRADAEANARVVSPAQRAVSRTLGRRLTRTASRCWPDPLLDLVAEVHPEGPHQPVALGAAGVAANLDAVSVAVAALHGSVTTPATAAVRLLGLDPVAVHALLASFAPDVERIATTAVADVQRAGLEGVAAPGAPRSEIAAELHAHQEVRLFAS